MTTSVRFCLPYDRFKLDFIVFKVDIISIENATLLWTSLWSYMYTPKCYVTCGHMIFMTWCYPLNNSDVIIMIKGADKSFLAYLTRIFVNRTRAWKWPLTCTTTLVHDVSMTILTSSLMSWGHFHVSFHQTFQRQHNIKEEPNRTFLDRKM